MRAIAITEYGGPETLRPLELPRPRPKRGEVLIRVVAAGVNPIDCRLRRGELQDVVDPRLPRVPGLDAAGVIEEQGDAAMRFRKGDRVFATTGARIPDRGCYAEYVTLPETQVAPMPAKLLFEEAAAVPLAALAASQALDRLPAGVSDPAVLVLGAGGGVGHFAIQLARRAGATVLGVAAAPKLPLVLGLGATVGIDAGGEPAEAAARRHRPDGVDLIVDTVGGEVGRRALGALKDGGRLVSLVEAHDSDAAELQATAPDGERLGELARLFDQQALKVEVQKIFRLKQAAAAHRLQESRGVRGKLVLNV